MQVVAAALLAALPVLSFADAMPADAAPLEPDALRARMADHTFGATLSNGARVEVQYKANGMAFAQGKGAGAGAASDTGKWHVDGTRLCLEWRKSANGCYEMRDAAGTLYLLRSDGTFSPLDAR